jgi:hypothetical protein
MKTLICIDAYLSNNERVNVCYNLIRKIKSTLPNYKILLLNKHINSGNLESEVDYYFYYGDSVKIGSPSEEILNSGAYNNPYVYFDIGHGVIENWLPLEGVTDHVANIYNSFILSSNIAKTLGFNYVFRIEYDIEFDTNELVRIKDDIEKYPFYLLYGKRHEGQWKHPEHYLVDVHMVGYHTTFFNGFSLVNNEDEYWKLCERVGYFGKWIEYLISVILEYQKSQNKIPNGECYSGNMREMFPKTKFDKISGGEIWTNRWKTVPRICKISPDNGETELKDKIIVFYWNRDYDTMTINLKSSTNYEKEITLPNDVWAYDILDLNETIYFDSIVTTETETYHCKQVASPENLSEINNRFVYRG